MEVYVFCVSKEKFLIFYLPLVLICGNNVIVDQQNTWVRPASLKTCTEQGCQSDVAVTSQPTGPQG